MNEGCLELLTPVKTQLVLNGHQLGLWSEGQHQNSLASTLDAIHAQDEGWGIEIASMFLLVNPQPFYDERNAILGLVINYLGHGEFSGFSSKFDPPSGASSSYLKTRLGGR
jgi:hypothetical protein